VFRRCLVLAMMAAPATAGASELPDPMRPPDFESEAADEAEQASPRPSLTLQSTLIAPGRRSAVINGRSVEVGAAVAGVRVVAIHATKVRLRGGQGAFTLRLPSAVNRQKVESGE